MSPLFSLLTEIVFVRQSRLSQKPVITGSITSTGQKTILSKLSQSKRLMDFADKDHDCRISREEFESLLEGLDYVTAATVVHVFQDAGVGCM